jgi:hypothetical protein
MKREEGRRKNEEERMNKEDFSLSPLSQSRTPGSLNLRLSGSGALN